MSDHASGVRRSTIAVVVDVDGVVAPVGGSSEWGDDAYAGDVFGPVFVSPSLSARLDHLHEMEGVQCWWLTSWTASMRGGMDHFPGRSWRVIADPEAITTASGASPPLFAGRSWWKGDAILRWLSLQRGLGGIVWCEDHLRGPDESWLLRDVVRQQLDELDIPSLLVAPESHVGLRPADMDRIERWVAATRTGRHPTPR